MSRSIVTRHNKNGVIIKLWGGGSDKKDKQKIAGNQQNNAQEIKMSEQKELKKAV